MSTRLPPEATDPSFRIGQSTTIQGTGAVGAPGAAALPDDDEPTARSMALNFADEPVERPALEGAKPGTKQDPTRPTNQQILKSEQRTKDSKTNKSVERRHDELVAQGKRKEKLREEKIDQEKRLIKNKKLAIAADVDRVKRKKLVAQHEVELKKKKALSTQYEVEQKKKKLAWRAEVYAQDKKRALKVQEANGSAARSSAKSAALRSAAAKGVHTNSIDPNALAVQSGAPLIGPAPTADAGDMPAVASAGGGDAPSTGGGGGGEAPSTGGGGGGGGTQTA